MTGLAKWTLAASVSIRRATRSVQNRKSVVAAAALAACKADWSKARTYFSGWVERDELLRDLITATNKFLSGSQARQAFRGGWTKEELFGITLEPPHQLGLICAVVNASLAIECFDGGWVFVKTPAMSGEDGGDEVVRYFRTTFQYRDSMPWWRHPAYSPIRPSHQP